VKRKSSKVAVHFHSMLTSFLFEVDELYRKWGVELVITSGSELTKVHGYTSLHYATPAQAADIRTWDMITHSHGKVPKPHSQKEYLVELAKRFCLREKIPLDWIEIILETDHIHIEYQPKRPA